MARTALTAITIRKLKPPTSRTTRRERYDGLVPGLGIRVTYDGFKSWIFLYTSPTKRKRRRYTIGPVLNAPNEIEDMRAKASELRKKVRAGIDPADEEQARRAQTIGKTGVDIAAVFEHYGKRHLADKRTGTVIRQIINRELVSHWKSRPIAAITSKDIRERIDALIDADAPQAGRRLLAILRHFFSWAVRQETYGLERSPCEQIRAKDMLGEKPIRTRILTDLELRALWHASGNMGYPFAPLLRLLVLTGLRRNEVAQAPWSEFDLDKALWLIPPERMKAEAAHTVPLTAEMLAIIASLPRTGKFLFASGRRGDKPVSGFSNMKERLDSLMQAELNRIAGERGEVELEAWAVHDIRRTMRTHLSALPVTDLVRELVIGHTKPGLHKIYDQWAYLAEKRHALELWQKRLQGIVDPPPPSADNVVALRA